MKASFTDLRVLVEDDLPKAFILPESFTWAADITISNFIADWLRKFSMSTKNLPVKYMEMANDDYDLAFEYYREDLEALAAQFDYISKHSLTSAKQVQPYIDTAFAKLAKLYRTLWW